MTKTLRALALALTTLALLATSTEGPPYCPAGPLVPGPTQVAVDTTCGPAGTVTLTVDPETCAVTVGGAAATGLPSTGTLDHGRLTLREGDRHCDCEERAPGEWNARCYAFEDVNAIGCGGSDLPTCDGVLTVAVP